VASGSNGGAGGDDVLNEENTFSDYVATLCHPKDLSQSPQTFAV
jgi:hypothetical protein